jgi:hypothetical protein
MSHDCLWTGVKQNSMGSPATIAILAELHRTAELGMYRHYAAARRSHRYQRGISVFQIAVNILLGSALLYAITEMLPSFAKWFGATLALIAAAMGGFESYFGFGKSFERHHKIANAYRAIARECEEWEALYEDGLADLGTIAHQLPVLRQRYNEENRNAEDVLPRDSDYSVALLKQEARQKSVRERRALANEVRPPL